MKRLLTMLGIGLLVVSVGACGATRQSARSTPKNDAAQAATVAKATTPGATAVLGRFKGDEDDDELAADANARETGDGDADFDNDAKDNVDRTYHDSDDGAVLDFGHAASAADRQAIVSVVNRYFAAAAAGDATTACSLTFSLLGEALSEDYGHAPGPLYLRGTKTCAEVLSRMFKHLHAQLVQPVKVTGVRIRAHRAYAVLGSNTMAASETELRRERGVWRIDRVLSAALP